MTVNVSTGGPSAERAQQFVSDGAVVGLGTGRAASAFIGVLGRRVQAGLQVLAVPTSGASADLATALGIPLGDFDQIASIDVTVDGADEVDPQGNLIKGYGGALVREKIVAAASKKLVILIGEDKVVPVLGSRGKLPVEVLPFGVMATAGHLRALGLAPQPRLTSNGLFVSDNGNLVLDCATGPVEQPDVLEAQVRAIPGVVGTGLFLGMADVILIQRGEHVEVREPSRKSID